MFANKLPGMNEPDKQIILYADDDPDDIELLKEAFACISEDIELITCTNGVEALEYLQTLTSKDETPCLIILDINMPVLDGKQTLIRLRTLTPYTNTPVVLFSTSSDNREKEFARQHEAGFITKPLDLKEMAKIADSFIDHCTENVKKILRQHTRG